MILRRVWIPNDLWADPQVRWREADHIPPAAQCISAPDAAAAHDARQDTTPWGATTSISPQPVRLLCRR